MAKAGSLNFLQSAKLKHGAKNKGTRHF